MKKEKNSINKWLNNTSFDIFVVESNGYNFHEIINYIHIYNII